jgi:O-antigen/teichoic acid export membrane protein
MKATSVFGGVQFFKILIGIVRSKIIAELLGPAGMGISGLFQSTLGLVAGMTNFGLATSAVKEISTANNVGDISKLNRVVSVFVKLMSLLGGLGMLVTLVGANLFSVLTFGSDAYTWSFIFLSFTLFLNQVSAGQSAILQGLRKTNSMAKSSVWGGLIGLFFSLPLYYFLGVDGIVPGLIVAALATLILNYIYYRKVSVSVLRLSWTEVFREGFGMLRMGFFLSLNTLLVLFSSYIVRIFINTYGSIEDVGLYNAGFAIVSSYVGMIFTAMSLDYFPRLAEVANDPEEASRVVSQQAEMALLLITPIIIFFIMVIKWVIIALYSNEFLQIQSMVVFAASGMLFKAFSWCVSFLFLAKGESKSFFFNELVANVYSLVFNISGYYYFGLVGLGYAFVLSFLLYSIQVAVVTTKVFKLSFSKDLKSTLLVCLLFLFFSVLIGLNFSSLVYFTLGPLFFLGSATYSFLILNRRMGVVSLLRNNFSRK